MSVFTLHNAEREDEAEIVALEFNIEGRWATITPRYQGYPDWETSKTVPVAEARRIWAENVRSGRFVWDGVN